MNLELKTRSINAYKMWLHNEKPRNGIIFQNKIKCHYDYKKAIIAAKNKAKYKFSDKFLNQLLSKNVNGFWSAWRSHTRRELNMLSCLTQSRIHNK